MNRHPFLLAATALLLVATPAVALPPPPSAPFTLWNFLGIPQGLNKIRDATANKKGNFPGLERSPALMAIADPKNLESANPAIKAAAEIKTEEDLAPQKIKALKYLSTIGCDSGCYPQVKEAMMAALEDCTEEVRYQAVLAIQDAITQHCRPCDKACCCSEEMVTKLAERAYERDASGCFIEPSERVREAAKVVMCTCCPYGGGPVAPQQMQQDDAEVVPEGVPTPMPPTVPEGPSAQHSIWRQGLLTGMLPSVAAWPEPARPARVQAPARPSSMTVAARPTRQPAGSTSQAQPQVKPTAPVADDQPTETALRPATPPLPMTMFVSSRQLVESTPVEKVAEPVAKSVPAPQAEAPAATPVKAHKTTTQPTGPSSRRNAAERGLAPATDATPAGSDSASLRRPPLTR